MQVAHARFVLPVNIKIALVRHQQSATHVQMVATCWMLLKMQQNINAKISACFVKQENHSPPIPPSVMIVLRENFKSKRVFCWHHANFA